ncbi:hypothetical protein PaG_02464 [Moesziomyces aphidis]|uniref:L-rhamnose mutarotase n=1 Tax=Moesziomyces aphidis TaxID=84754 RepID=W3VPN8_MOEAP|nr:hypothetical protein PaG_02464 [Moesziomyces aphidis]
MEVTSHAALALLPYEPHLGHLLHRCFGTDPQVSPTLTFSQVRSKPSVASAWTSTRSIAPPPSVDACCLAIILLIPPFRSTTMVRQEVLVLDIASDPSLVAQYIDHHAPGNVPPAVLASIRSAGIHNMRIFNFADRLVMLIDVDDDFDFAAKAASDGDNPDVEKWERLMQKFQREIPDPQGKQTDKWKHTQLCFDLSQHK